MSKVIFLDIDGVLLPTTYARFLEQAEHLSRGTAVGQDDFMEHFAPYCVANVQKLARVTGARIVFTSVRKADRPDGPTWLQAMWASRYSSPPVLGATPTLDNQQYRRGDEIRHWLSAHHCEQYVILDDMGPAHFHTEQLSFLIQCDEKWGFTTVELARALITLRCLDRPTTATSY
ncbi:hypothetical protein PK28_17025 (plasmid) [Hymenobacter sp. DG25B]|uniref:HAD domain-containing protein n=1 Tax=Hymenobacter sp. DG25B TaxID=1385664 RepID=UPI000540BE0D|nr:HAD domain-containing protein [Hymenobacter sp. DG25B]AIZ65377.1 hypothetical protein PK28_17025 [Hymenobacter sp. DG25B]